MTQGIPCEPPSDLRQMASAMRQLPPPYAEVIRIGRWRYRWQIIDGIGLTGNDGWYTYGHDRAMRKAARSLAAYVGYERPVPERVAVTDSWAGGKT